MAVAEDPWFTVLFVIMVLDWPPMVPVTLMVPHWLIDPSMRVKLCWVASLCEFPIPGVLKWLQFMKDLASAVAARLKALTAIIAARIRAKVFFILIHSLNFQKENVG